MEQITIQWKYGTEKINVDLSRLGDENYLITETCQDIAGNMVPYVTSSEIEPLGEGRFNVKIYYGKEVNLAVKQFDYPWGYITLDLQAGITTGRAYWNDDRPGLKEALPFRMESVSTEERDPFAFLGDHAEDVSMGEIRRTQWLFRRNVQFWEQSCRVTGIDNPRFLAASHMKRWHAAEKREKIAGYNGLMLAPNVCHLFDHHFISFKDSGDLLVSDRLPEPIRAALLPAKCTVPRPFVAAQQPYLEIHRSHFVALNKAD